MSECLFGFACVFFCFVLFCFVLFCFVCLFVACLFICLFCLFCLFLFWFVCFGARNSTEANKEHEEETNRGVFEITVEQRNQPGETGDPSSAPLGA